MEATQMILLEENMLVSAGFKKENSQKYVYVDESLGYYVSVNIKRKVIQISSKTASCKLFNHPFVYQLQDALRLCGMDSIADRFKIIIAYNLTKEDYIQIASLLNQARKRRSTKVFAGHPQEEWMKQILESVKGKRGHFSIGNPYYDDYGKGIKFHFD